MFITIANDRLTVTIRKIGAELWSVRGETEYLWQGDPAYWTGRATTIFPYVARLNDGRYTADGEPYRLPIHGFANHCLFTVARQSKEEVALELADSHLTRAMYPYPFVLGVRYALRGNLLEITYSVENTGTGAMYFGLGGHPGFNVPLEDGLRFSDYTLRFDAPCAPRRVLFTPDCFVTGNSEPFPLENGDTLRLRHGLFDDDAVILRDMAKTVTLAADKGRRGVCVSYPQMRYLGIWHKPHSDAPYVCIEPWSSLPARKGELTELSAQKDLIALGAGEAYRNTWSIEALA